MKVPFNPPFKTASKCPEQKIALLQVSVTNSARSAVTLQSLSVDTETCSEAGTGRKTPEDREWGAFSVACEAAAVPAWIGCEDLQGSEIRL